MLLLCVLVSMPKAFTWAAAAGGSVICTCRWTPVTLRLGKQKQLLELRPAAKQPRKLELRRAAKPSRGAGQARGVAVPSLWQSSAVSSSVGPPLARLRRRRSHN